MNLSLVDQRLVKLETALVDQETGQRGYDLTGDSAFLEPFNQGTEEFNQLSHQLDTQVKQSRLSNVGPIVEDAIDLGQTWHTEYGQPQVTERKSGSMVSITDLLKGNTVMSAFRAKIDAGVSVFNTNIVKESNRVTVFSRLMLVIHIVIILVTMGVLVTPTAEYTRLNEQTVNREKMRLVGELAASMAHEIKNPIQVTRGFIQLIQEVTEDEKIKQYVAHSIHALDDSHRVISEYLSLAKPTSPKREWVQLSETLNDVVDLLSAYGAQHGCAFRVIVQNECTLFTDVEKLKQILLNVAKNAIESLEGTGIVTLTCKSSGNHATITIKDTGPGMSGEQLARLGMPFYNTKEQGTGLGMMIVYRLVQELEGTIDVQSVIGTGTAVMITFLMPEHRADIVESNQHNQLPHGI